MAVIGVFDSGVGGLTILDAVTHRIQDTVFHYVADSGFAPYGSRDRAYIINRSLALTRFLISKGADIIVVACNTATGAAISTLRDQFDLPFIGVEPAIKPAVAESRTGHVGVLATRQTFQGEHFQRTTGLYARNVEVHVQPGDGLVEIIEDGIRDVAALESLLQEYLHSLLVKQVDQLVLGCTHYPLIIPYIRKILPMGIAIHEPSAAVARQTQKVLEAMNGIQTGSAKNDLFFYSTGDPKVLNQLAGQMWQKPVTAERVSLPS